MVKKILLLALIKPILWISLWINPTKANKLKKNFLALKRILENLKSLWKGVVLFVENLAIMLENAGLRKKKKSKKKACCEEWKEMRRQITLKSL